MQALRTGSAPAKDNTAKTRLTLATGAPGGTAARNQGHHHCRTPELFLRSTSRRCCREHDAPSPRAHSAWFRLEQRRIRDQPRSTSTEERLVLCPSSTNGRALDGFKRLDSAQNRTTSECPLFVVTAYTGFRRASSRVNNEIPPCAGSRCGHLTRSPSATMWTFVFMSGWRHGQCRGPVPILRPGFAVLVGT